MVSQERLKELLTYDESTGVFTWKVARPGHRAGVQAGSIYVFGENRRLRIKIDQRAYMAHQLVFLYLFGAFPNCNIDHKDGNALNNKPNNLRTDPDCRNPQNQRRPMSSNKSGFLGVVKQGKKWRARITAQGRKKHLGYFKTPQDAHMAYVSAKRILHEFCTI